MSQRVERVAGEVRAVIGEALARDELKDPRIRGAGLITVTHVRVSGDFQHARAFFTVHGLDEAAQERVRVGLDHASGFFRQAIARRLRMKVAPAVTFQVDKAFDQAAHVEQLLREIAPKPVPAEAATDDATTPDAADDTTTPDAADDTTTPDAAADTTTPDAAADDTDHRE
jgi:ribosome-binding factor A